MSTLNVHDAGGAQKKTTRFYGEAERAARAILTAFEQGTIPKALAPVFIRRRDEIPCRKWSWSNQLITALMGHSDARGFRQWQQVGRKVKAGERAFYILGPITKRVRSKDDEEDDERTIILGFKGIPVFGLSQTEGKELAPADPEVTAWLESLPLLDVARAWGITVETFNGAPRGPQGKYTGRSIALGVKNLSTWAHEMMHAADHRLGNLTERGQHWRSETVAELGGAILLEVLGEDMASDRGGCWNYVQHYAHDAELDPLVACQRVLKRTCDAVALILDTAAALSQSPAESVDVEAPAVSINRRALADAVAEVRFMEKEKRARANEVRETAWVHYNANKPGKWPFWRHGFAATFGKRVERADYTAIPGYDKLAQEMASLFPEYADDDGCQRLWSFLLSPYDKLPPREALQERAAELLAKRTTTSETVPF